MHFRKNEMTSWPLVLLLLAPPVIYGQPVVDTDEEPDIIEEVVVTGSRLLRSSLDSPSPVMVFNAALLKDTGITTLGEFARYLPQNADALSDSNSGFSNFRGSSAFNLRGIGLDATLTLVNGRRIAPFGSSGAESPFIDINSIPIAAIERIEVLLDGASAIYGSEAVAGVVNIITRKQVDEITVEGGYLTTTDGDGDEWDLSLVGGWASGSTSITGTLSYFERDVIWSRDREWSSDRDLSDQGGFNSRSSLSSPPTVILLESGAVLADPECPEQTRLNSRLVIEPGEFELCLFNFAQFTTLQNPSNRWGLTATLEHVFSPRLTFFAETLFNRNRTQSIAAPLAYRAEFVPGHHPDNPWNEDLLLFARAVDIGNRGFSTEVTTWRVLTGLRGLISDWEWEAALMSSQSKSDDTLVNAVLAEEFRDALLGFGGPNQDQFYNPFGLNPQNSPEVIEQFLTSGIGTTQTNEELTIDFQITGNFGRLPGGPAGAAFGFQARKQTLEQFADEELLPGVLLAAFELDPLNQDRNIYSVFAEFVLPLLDTLELQLAARWDDYSVFGSTTNPKVGLLWHPLEELLLRATWGTSFRPPTFRELYDPRQVFDDIIFTDPHRCPVTGDFFDCVFHEVEAEYQGNLDLQPDEGETMLFGFAWEPHFAPDLTLSLNFWQVEHKNRILSSDDFLLESILEQLDPFTNPFIIRAPQTAQDLALGIPGVIIKTHSTYINGDTLKTNGVDFAIHYRWNTQRAGDFTAALNYTYLNEYGFVTGFREISISEDFAGRYGTVSGLPRHRGNISIGWNRNGDGISALITYTGDYESPINLVVDGGQTETPFKVDDDIQLNLQYSHAFEDLRGGTLRIGCRNCTGADPPIYNYTVDSEAFHEGRGAMVYARWSQPF